MAEPGDIVYFLCKDTSDENVRLCGWVVGSTGEDVLVAVGAEASKEVEQVVRPADSATKVGFLRVHRDSVVLSAPAGWTGPKPRDLPALGVCQSAWKKVDKDSVSSSEAEPPRERRSRAAKASSKLASDLGHLGGLFEGSDSEEDAEPDSWLGRRRQSSGHLAPGAKATSSAKGSRSKDDEVDINRMLSKALAQGQSGQELMPLMMMSMLMDQQKRKKARKNCDAGELLGGSSSEDSEDFEGGRGHGMKAVSTLHRLHQKIRTHPRRVCAQFEKEVVEELGVVSGQPWTLKDFLKKQNWGKFKGLYRCAVMDAVAYELLRSGEADAAAAQLVQNLKAKIQSVIQGGDWSAAWLLTGIADPLVKREFAGSKEEMAVVSGYLDALSKLRKKVKETGGNHQAEEEEDGAARAHRK